MEGSEYLNTVAQLAVAVIGFAAIALAIRGSENIADFKGLIESLVSRGIATVLFALLPSLLFYLDIPTEISLPLCSGLMAVYLGMAFVWLYQRFYRSAIHIETASGGAAFRLALIGVMIPIQALAAAQIMPFSSLGLYLFGVTWLLVLTGGPFTTILWRAF